MPDRIFTASAEGIEVTDAPQAQSAPGYDLFTAHIMALNATGLMHLGHLGDEPVDRESAQYVIDTLDMLEQKTAGNLTADEHKMLGAVLYDLRMKFVEAA